MISADTPQPAGDVTPDTRTLTRRFKRCTCGALALAFIVTLGTMDGPGAGPVPRTGTLRGRFVFDGDPPAPIDLYPGLAKIDLAQPHPGPERFDGVEGLYRQFLDHRIRPSTLDQSLQIGKKHGIANVVIWATSKEIPCHVPLEPGRRPVTIKLKGGHYSPRVAVAMTGQTILIENHDPLTFHFRAEPGQAGNKPINHLLKPNSARMPLRLVWYEPEAQPIRYESNLGPWANGWVFVHRNAFVAVSGPDGSFALPGLPPGKLEFRVWHERQGYLKQWPRGQFQYTIQPGDTTLGEIKLSPLFFVRR
ncbi:MAG: carboxypeptidase-like regulatory domain-containing protein [Gemmataceae bacterium]